RRRVRGGGDARREVGRGAQGLRHPAARRPGQRAGDHRLLPRAPRALQVPEGGRVRRAAQDVHGQDPEVPPARKGVGGAREADLRRARLSGPGFVRRDSCWDARRARSPGAMPVEYEVDTERGRVLARLVGDVTLREVIDHLRALAEDPALPERPDLLVDLSGLTAYPDRHEVQSAALEAERLAPKIG